LVRPPYLVEPQYIEGAFEESQGISGLKIRKRKSEIQKSGNSPDIPSVEVIRRFRIHQVPGV